MSDLISVIIPVYNGQEYIRNTIDCVLNQTYKNLEIIIVDDGSTDNTESECRLYSDSRLFYYKKNNGGPSDARNYGLGKITGKYVCFLDADDNFDSCHIECLYKRLMLNQCDFISNRINNDKKCGNKYIVTNNMEAIYKVLNDNDFGGYTMNKMFLASYIRKYNLRFKTEFWMCEDLVFVAEYLCLCQKCLFLNTCTYKYISNRGVSKFTRSEKRLSQFYAIVYLRNLFGEWKFCRDNMKNKNAELLDFKCVWTAIHIYAKIFFCKKFTQLKNDMKMEIDINYAIYKKLGNDRLIWKIIGFLEIIWIRSTKVITVWKN